jgi:PAS domain S-box-containing protein
MLVAPVIYGERALGVLVATNRPGEREYGQSDLDLISAMASQSAISIENAEIREQLRQARDELEQRVAQRTAELGASEERYRRITETITDYVFRVTLGPNGVFETHHSLGSIPVTGYSPEEFASQPNLWLEMVVAEDRDKVLAQVDDLLANGTARPVDHRIVRKDGAVRRVRSTPVPQFGPDGTLVGYDGLLQDITQTRALEDQLAQDSKLKSIGRLAGGVAHDFNNLLTAIFGYTDLAKTSLPSEHAAIRSLEMVEQAGRQARGVINSLLTFSQKDIPEKAPVGLAGSLVETVGLLRRLLPASIEIEEDMPTDREVWVNADPTQLQRVWMNLAVNAWDAMGRGGRLRVSLQAPAKAQQAGAIRPPAVVIIEDTGTGMSEEVQSRVFEPFFTTKPRGQGTGLGLSVTHAIVTNHGGRMEIESESGQGTRVRVFLPCCDPPPKAARAAPARRPAGRGESILVVEDDDQVRSILVSALRVQGYKVAVASDSAEAQLLFKKRHNILDLILMDMDLPKTSGTVLLRKIRRALPDVPILIVTGGAAGDAREEPERKQFLLRKPFQVSELVEEITKVLARSSRRGESRS